MNITASLVLYNSKPDVYCDAITSFLNGCDGHLYVVDNSSVPTSHELFDNPRVSYIFSGKNLGFGAAHNRAISYITDESGLHLIVNPDVKFGADVISHLSQQMKLAPDIGVLMPRIAYPNGELQRLCKLLPTPMELIFRRFIPSAALRDRVNARYELHGLRQDCQSEVPSLSGCFLMVRTALLKKLRGFDERFFLYMEDVDLIRRLGDYSRAVYDPTVTVIHGYEKGSYKNRKLMLLHIKSAIAYFNKWGWVFDRTRRLRNRKVLQAIYGK